MTGAYIERKPRALIRPWLILVAPALAWFVYEVGLAGALRLSCGMVGGWLGAAWGGASLLACAASAARARAQLRSVDDKSASRPWLVRVALVAAGLFALAIVFQTTATLLVPSCAR